MYISDSRVNIRPSVIIRPYVILNPQSITDIFPFLKCVLGSRGYETWHLINRYTWACSTYLFPTHILGVLHNYVDQGKKSSEKVDRFEICCLLVLRFFRSYLFSPIIHFGVKKWRLWYQQNWQHTELHTESFDWFLSGFEWILNLEFCLLKLLTFQQKSL